MTASEGRRGEVAESAAAAHHGIGTHGLDDEEAAVGAGTTELETTAPD